METSEVKVIATALGLDLYVSGILVAEFSNSTQTWTWFNCEPVEPPDPVEPPPTAEHIHPKAPAKVIRDAEYTLQEEDAGVNLYFYGPSHVKLTIPEGIERLDQFGIFYQGIIEYIREDGLELPEWNVDYIHKVSDTGWTRVR